MGWAPAGGEPLADAAVAAVAVGEVAEVAGPAEARPMGNWGEVVRPVWGERVVEVADTDWARPGVAGAART